MNKKIVLILLISLINDFCYSQKSYSELFTGKMLRLNYTITNYKDSVEAKFVDFSVANKWGGENYVVNNCKKYGIFYMEMIDSCSNNVLYTYSYNSLFSEWLDIDLSKNKSKTYKECVKMPFPKKTCLINVYKLNSKHEYKLILSEYFNPKYDKFKCKTSTTYPYKHIKSSKSKNSINIAILAEGYQKNEKKKFLQSAKEYSERIFETEPYKKYQKLFNVYAVFDESKDNGCDIPNKNIYKNTIMDFSYNTFNMERYVMSENYWAISNVAQSVPYNHIIVLVNSDIYGGGGIYNYYSVFSANNYHSKEVMVHELGHSFAGLDDEYEDNATYNTDIDNKYEILSPNLTNLVEFSSKWEKYIDKSTPIPTPKNSKHKIGVFEGGRYCYKGIYRPCLHCLMHDLETNYYCEICEKIVEETILNQTQNNE
ncbi:MAG: IgA Peptidase M64 [Bacteroidales bacterium]|nr:IgA Peptidase M64 [Bacteroidales bacterium]